MIKKVGAALFYGLLYLCLFIGTVGNAILWWYKENFSVGIAGIIYTLNGPLKGADISFLWGLGKKSCFSLLLFLIVVLVICFFKRIRKRLIINLNIKGFRISVISLFFVVCFFASLYLACKVVRDTDDALKISDYVSNRLKPTHIYEERYIKPDIDRISGTSTKNLIYIYLESMETTYASEEDGGYQIANNYIPHLTELAGENISFSNSEALGGFRCPSGTGWTIAAMFASESGLPFMFPVEGNDDFENRSGMANGTITLGDILKEKGYYQEFLCGSDATFGGRRAFFEQHGGFEIYDLDVAIKNGYITEEQKVWWGLEDKNLYRIAKDELTRVSDLGEPFNFTMLTVDTHHENGWICDLCGDEYPDQLANVLKCADNQIYDFINWCQTQPWYENTVIVIQGDHPRMDTALVGGINNDDRTVYNCFINAQYDEKALNNKNRDFTSMDMFPTILSAMGFEVPDDRLGMGTNLFSDKPTLSEELGYDYYKKELSKYSQYYLDNF